MIEGGKWVYTPFQLMPWRKLGYFFYPEAALGPKQLKEIYHSPAAQRPGGELGDVV